jgi:probable phosphoglycerate mutase
LTELVWPTPEEPTRILAIRHGQTAWNADKRIQGQLDLPLNDTGLLQARRLAEALFEEPIAAIYCSDLSRAVQTALPLAERKGLVLRRDSALRERGFGEFQGLTFDEITERWPEQALRWRRRDPEYGPAGGERLVDFHARCVAAAWRLAALHPGQTIALVAHGGVMDCLHRSAVGVSVSAARTWQLDNAAVNRLLWSPQGMTLVGWNDVSHLEDLAPGG